MIMPPEADPDYMDPDADDDSDRGSDRDAG